jgi:hypothetical protein
LAPETGSNRTAESPAYLAGNCREERVESDASPIDSILKTEMNTCRLAGKSLNTRITCAY